MTLRLKLYFRTALLLVLVTGVQVIATEALAAVATNQGGLDYAILFNYRYWVLGIIFIALIFFVTGFVMLRRSRKLLNHHRKLLVDQAQELEAQKLALDKHAIVSIADLKGTITYANDKFCEISGYTQSELIGQNHRLLKSGEHSGMFFGDMWATMASGKPWQGDIKNRRKDGTHYWVNTTIYPQLNINGEVKQYIAIRTDITANKEAQKALLEAYEEAKLQVFEIASGQRRVEEAASKQTQLAEELAIARDRADSSNVAKSSFLAAMSHEIRTPLTGVMGFADLLLESPLSAGDLDKVSSIKRAAYALMTIINDILDISKMEAGKLEIENLDFNLPLEIDAVMNLFAAKRDEKGIALTQDLSAGFPTEVNADPTRLRQVLVNLIGNAMKFTDSGAVTIIGSVCTLNDGTPGFEIGVRDTGIGIKADVLDTLFSDFVQADISISRKFQGTGLGLSICKKLVGLMGGNIGVDSEYGGGSTFWFRLPLSPATTKLPLIENPLLKSGEAEARRSLNILVAEDNLMNQKVIEMLMGMVGHKVTIAENGVKAVECHKAGDYDLILMDVRMPEMSGPEATVMIRRLAGDKANIPIIALTADAEQEKEEAYLKAGMNAMASKPIDRHKLMLIMNTVMGEEIHVIGDGSERESTSVPPPPAESNIDSKPDKSVHDLIALMQDVDGVD